MNNWFLCCNRDSLFCTIYETVSNPCYWDTHLYTQPCTHVQAYKVMMNNVLTFNRDSKFFFVKFPCLLTSQLKLSLFPSIVSLYLTFVLFCTTTPFFRQTILGAGAPSAGHHKNDDWLCNTNWVVITLLMFGVTEKIKKCAVNKQATDRTESAFHTIVLLIQK